MARLAYFVHGRGRGHAMCARYVLPRLVADGHALRSFGGASAADVLRGDEGFTEIEAFAPGRRLGRRFVRRFQSDLSRLRSLRPDLVISDGDAPSIHAARWLRIPSLAINHGLIFWHCELPKHLPRWGLLREGVNAASSSWLSQRRIAVHFSPLESKDQRTYVARPDVAFSPDDDAAAPTEDFILTYFSVDAGTEALELLARTGRKIVCFTHAEALPKGVVRMTPSASVFADHLRRCRAVVGLAGNSLPAECAILQKPLFVLYRDGDLQTQMNALLVEHAGIGTQSSFAELSLEKLQRFLSTIDEPPARREDIESMPPLSDVTGRVVQEMLDDG